jgi:DNA-directed RNA polymerase subunit RPC12/RpoP
MGIRFNCQNCGKTLNVKSSLGGKRGLCPHCQSRILIPAENSEGQIEGEATVSAGGTPTTPAPVAAPFAEPAAPVVATLVSPGRVVAPAENLGADAPSTPALPSALPVAPALPSALPVAAPVAAAIAMPVTMGMAIEIDAAPVVRRRPASKGSLVVIGLLSLAVVVLSYFVFQVIRNTATSGKSPGGAADEKNR